MKNQADGELRTRTAKNTEMYLMRRSDDTPVRREPDWAHFRWQFMYAVDFPVVIANSTQDTNGTEFE
jgi:hypothetical protein